MPEPGAILTVQRVAPAVSGCRFSHGAPQVQGLKPPGLWFEGAGAWPVGKEVPKGKLTRGRHRSCSPAAQRGLQGPARSRCPVSSGLSLIPEGILLLRHTGPPPQTQQWALLSFSELRQPGALRGRNPPRSSPGAGWGGGGHGPALRKAPRPFTKHLRQSCGFTLVTLHLSSSRRNPVLTEIGEAAPGPGWGPLQIPPKPRLR